MKYGLNTLDAATWIAAASLVACAPLAAQTGTGVAAFPRAAHEAHAAAATAAPAGVVPASEREAIRRATERYLDVSVALADGYLRDPSGMCISADMEGQPRQLGAMGFHYFRPDILGITATEPRVGGTGTSTDFTRPGVLIYAPQRDGSLKLVAIENLVFEAAWKAQGHDGAPSFHGHEYFHMVDNPLTEADEAHGFEPHYELHYWLYEENPAGPFTPFNPRIDCAVTG